jgi:hypothetical protein
MRRLVILGVCFVAGAELLVLLLHQRRLVLVIAGIAAALLLLVLRRLLGRDVEPEPVPPDSSAGDSLQHWLTHTETLIHWSESTRTDWDRRWRPRLARRFENATGQSRRKDLAAFNATGEILFGAQLWRWVDPSNVADDGDREPGPGRAALEDILQRLEQA